MPSNFHNLISHIRAYTHIHTHTHTYLHNKHTPLCTFWCTYCLTGWKGTWVCEADKHKALEMYKVCKLVSSFLCVKSNLLCQTFHVMVRAMLQAVSVLVGAKII